MAEHKSWAVAPEIVIPVERLPPGFAERVESPPERPAPALPAATAVLMRDAEPGPEILLLRRSRDSGFVPGAYVFPGGRVDDVDAEPALLALVDGLPAEAGPGVAGSEKLPSAAYWIAAAREVFEEAGILLAARAVGEDGGRGETGGGRREVGVGARKPELGTRSSEPGTGNWEPGTGNPELWRDRLLEDRATLIDVLRALGARLDLGDMVYCAHWITPVAERRRYDTRFFLASVPADSAVRLDPREMTDALWLTPAEAVDRFADGALPMVFPTVKTLESLASFTSVRQALEAFRQRRIEPVLPRLVRTAGGIGIIVS